jgi:hypothetical protein
MLWPPVHRAIAVGEALLVATALAEACHLIRLHPRADEPYDRMTVVMEREGGDTLFLAGWLGSILSDHLAILRVGQTTLFPNAKFVTWERRRLDGSIHVARRQI